MLNIKKGDVEMSCVQLITTIVSSHDSSELIKAREKAIDIFGVNRVSESLGGSVGQYKTFMITPSGSMVGWDDELIHKKQLNEYLNHIKSNDLVRYAIVSYGDYGAKMERTNQVDCINGKICEC